MRDWRNQISGAPVAGLCWLGTGLRRASLPRLHFSVRENTFVRGTGKMAGAKGAGWSLTPEPTVETIGNFTSLCDTPGEEL